MNVLVYLLIAVTVWLHRRRKPTWFTLIPAVVMIVTTMAALGYKLLTDYLPNANVLLASVDVVLLALAVGVIRLSIKKLAAPRVAAASSSR